MSFAAKAKAATTPIHFLYGRVEGVQFHWFIMCSHEKFKVLRDKFGGEPVDLGDYGIVVARGFGHKPSYETKLLLKTKYGYDAEDLQSTG